MAESVDSLVTVAWPTALDPLESGTEVSLTVTRTVYVPDAASLIAIAGYEDPDDTEEERVFFTETAPRMLVRYKYNPIDRGPTTMTYFYDVINAFRDCPLLAKVRISRRLHDWLTQNAGWYAANPNLGLPNGTVEIHD